MFIDLKSDEKQSRITSVKLLFFLIAILMARGWELIGFGFWVLTHPPITLVKNNIFFFFLAI